MSDRREKIRERLERDYSFVEGRRKALADIAYLLEIAEAAREVVAERDDLGMAVEDEDGLWDAIDRLRDALEAENE